MLNMTFTKAILSATRFAMQNDPRVHLFGLGADYPNGLDGTARGLASEFPGRVHDTPCSEAAVTGLCVGAAASGLRPIVHHGRTEFAFFAMDQIATQAAKWRVMFGGERRCPVVIRVCAGRQWGNGPQHTQAPHALFAHLPGLRVVVPSSPAMASGLMIEALRCLDPVVYVEQRWLYKTSGLVVEGEAYPLHKARVMREGAGITVVAVGDMVLEALRAAKLVPEADAEIIDAVTLSPIDYQTIGVSVRKTGRLLVVSSDNASYGIGKEICATLTSSYWGQLRERPRSLNCPDKPCPTAPEQTQEYYQTDFDIAEAMARMTSTVFQWPEKRKTFEQYHLPPTEDFEQLCAGR